MTVLPVFLGDGTRLFDTRGGRTVTLETVSVTPAPPGVNLRMRVVR